MTPIKATRARTIRGDAEFSDDGRYRYWLRRQWDDALPQLTYVLLNPSKAGATDDGDRTVPKLVTLTEINGGGGFELVNLFAVLDTRQIGLHLPGAIGETAAKNNKWIKEAVNRSETLILGWGDGNTDDGGSRGRQAAGTGSVVDGFPLRCLVLPSDRQRGAGVPGAAEW
jgi:hypothetical protein